MKQKSIIKSTNKIEKKSALLYIFDLYMQRKIRISFIMKDKNTYYQEYKPVFDIIWESESYYRQKKRNYYESNDLNICNEYTMQIYKSISKKENLNIFNNTNEKNYIKDEINTLKNSPKLKSNNIINIDNEDSDSFKDNELNIVTNTDCKINFHNNKKLITNVNSDLKELISDNKNLPVSKINLIPITGDGNCFYRCVSYFFINDEEGYEEIKAIIIEWIEHNYNQYLDFFGDDENNYLSIEEIAKRELDYIKLKDSWGSDYTISITCLIFNINNAVYVFNGSNEY